MESLNEIQKGHTEWKIREKNFSKIVLTNVFELHIIEIPKIKRQLKKIKVCEEEKELATWIKFLTNPEELGELDMGENEELKKAKEEFENMQNSIALGQSVVLYDKDIVLGGGIITRKGD